MTALDDTIRFSLKQLLLAFAAVSFLLGTFLIWGFAPTFAIVLYLSLALPPKLPYRQRMRFKEITIAVTIVSSMGLFLSLVAWILGGLGPHYISATYPRDLHEMIEVAGTSTWRTKAYGNGGFLDQQRTWRMTITSEQLDRLIEHYEFLEVPPNLVPPQFTQKFPRHWRPRPGKDSHFYRTEGFDGVGRGEDGLHYFAMYEPGTRRFYVWCKDNF